MSATAEPVPTDLPEDTEDAAASELDAAASACAFLAHLLLRPEAGGYVVGSLGPALVADWPLERDADTARGLAHLRAALRDPLPDEEYRADHAQLFVGPGTMAACPWESVHRSEEGLTFEADTLRVRRAYAAAGFQAPALNREPDDHIGLELAFVGELAVRALEARDDGDRKGEEQARAAARSFVSDHLDAWAPRLAELVEARARIDLYRAVGALLAGALPQLGRIFAVAE